MTTFQFVCAIFYVVLNIIDLNRHNNKLEELFPYDTITKISGDNARYHLRIEMYGHYLALIFVVLLFINHVIEELR